MDLRSECNTQQWNRKKIERAEWVVAKLLICSANCITRSVPICFSTRLYRKWVAGMRRTYKLVVNQGGGSVGGEFYFHQLFYALKYLFKTLLFENES